MEPDIAIRHGRYGQVIFADGAKFAGCWGTRSVELRSARCKLTAIVSTRTRLAVIIRLTAKGVQAGIFVVSIPIGIGSSLRSLCILAHACELDELTGA